MLGELEDGICEICGHEGLVLDTEDGLLCELCADPSEVRVRERTISLEDLDEDEIEKLGFSEDYYDEEDEEEDEDNY